jgi:hypothetical protein
VFVSIKASPYARFKRALAIGNLTLVQAAAAELPQVDLTDALHICLLMGRHDDERYERAVVRWLARLALETSSIRLEDLRLGLYAFEALPYNPLGARTTLAQLCRTHGLHAATKMLEDQRAA